MRHLFEKKLKILCLSFTFTLSLSAGHAAPSGEIVFVHPIDFREIWIGSVDGRNTHRLFRDPILIRELSIQRGDRYILAVAEGIPDAETGVDVYLFDRQNKLAGRKDLTLGRFSEVCDAAISQNGDVVFANTIGGTLRNPDGIYLIPNREVHQPIPKVEKLFNGPACHVDWAPNGEDVVFSNWDGIFLLNIFAKPVSHIIKNGYRPVFSPDGKRIAFFIKDAKRDSQIGIVSLNAPANVRRIKIHESGVPIYLTWSTDGEYIAYAVITEVLQDLHQKWLYSNFAMQVSNGKHHHILQAFKTGSGAFEWISEAYPVEPTNLLTATWGKLKAPPGTEDVKPE